jgi:hypothetical protein
LLCYLDDLHHFLPRFILATNIPMFLLGLCPPNLSLHFIKGDFSKADSKQLDFFDIFPGESKYCLWANCNLTL